MNILHKLNFYSDLRTKIGTVPIFTGNFWIINWIFQTFDNLKEKSLNPTIGKNLTFIDLKFMSGIQRSEYQMRISGNKPGHGHLHPFDIEVN